MWETLVADAPAQPASAAIAIASESDRQEAAGIGGLSADGIPSGVPDAGKPVEAGGES